MQLPKTLWQFSFKREPVWMFIFMMTPALLAFLMFMLIRLVRWVF